MDFDLQSKPFVLPKETTASWAAREQWSPEQLVTRYPARPFDLGKECGSCASLPQYLESGSSDEYIFDSTVLDQDPTLAADFVAPQGSPQCFTEDYLYYFTSFSALRPRYRWFLVGNKGSGFAVHQDPHGTCAWNALLHGRKRWAVLPPGTPLSTVLPSQSSQQLGEHTDACAESPGLSESESTAAAWFTNILPLLQAAGVPGLQVFEQECGDVVFLPANWWHCAVTISTVSVGVTQNWYSNLGGSFRALKLLSHSLFFLEILCHPVLQSLPPLILLSLHPARYLIPLSAPLPYCLYPPCPPAILYLPHLPPCHTVAPHPPFLRPWSSSLHTRCPAVVPSLPTVSSNPHRLTRAGFEREVAKLAVVSPGAARAWLERVVAAGLPHTVPVCL